VDVPAYAAQPLWFTFHVPEKARPGTYRGTVKVEADGRTQASYPLTIEVADASAPDSDDYRFFLDVWAQPETIAQAHGVKLWSDKHWKLIEAYSRDLASRGQKVINTTIVDNPWHHQWSLGTRESQTATPFSSMVGWTWDGKSFSFDFARWDKYVRTARRAGLGPDIGAFSMLAFQDKEHLTYTDTRTGKTVYENVDLGGDRWREAWGAFLPAFEKHLKAKGWLENTWLSFDERPIDTMTVVKDFVHEVAPVFDDRISVAGSISTEGVASNLSVDWGGIDAMTKEKVAERRAAGKITTFYVYGSPAHPNTLSYSPAVE
ncbi:glycoside hydrolase domain-containing protein, partial [Streptomyces sp. 2MCAF27]